MVSLSQLPLQGETSSLVTIFLVILGIIIVLWLLAASIKIVKEYERVVVLRFGRLLGAKGPGIVFIAPIVNRLQKIDLRERYLEVPHQTTITKDNAPADIDFLIYYQVVDAALSVVKVQNFTGASVGLATTTLRAVVGDIPLDELLAKREQIDSTLRNKLDEVTERWGIKVTNVEIREIRPPKDVQEAMVKQMTAERTRRAMVLEADGRRESNVLVAEGDKNATVQSRRRQAIRHITSRRLCTSTGISLPSGQRNRRQDNGAAILGCLESVRRKPIHQVHLPDGVYKPRRSDQRLRDRRAEGRAAGKV